MPSAVERRPVLVTRRLALLAAVLVAIWGWVPLLLPQHIYVALPACASATLATIFLFTLWRWNGELPVFEIGAIFCVIMALYAVTPELSFLSAGGGWTSLSDGRLLFYNPGAREVGDFAWPYVGLMAGFTITYLCSRQRRRSPMRPLAPVDRATFVALLLVFVATQVYMRAIERVYGITLDPSYLDNGLSGFANYYSAPYFVQQVTHNVVGSVLAVKVCLVGALLLKWRSLPYRIFICLWVALEVLASFANMGSRTYMALFVFAVVLLYHRMVRPLTPRIALTAGAVMLAGFFVYGAMRDAGGSLQNAYDRETRVWTANNDFETMFSSAYDVYMTKTRLGFGSIPWQVYASDLYLLVPSQFLPFEKLEPSTWYYRFTNASTSSMFGIAAQSIVGFGWIELIVRGIFLGYLFAKLHDGYVRRSDSFWITLLYTYACLWSHYIFRATMMWPAYFVLYEFVPVMLLTRILAGQIRGRVAHPIPRTA